MQDVQNSLVNTSRWVVRTASLVNRLFFAAVTAGLLMSFLVPAHLKLLLADPGTDLSSTILGLRWLMLLGLAMAIATDRLLDALARIVASAGKGEQFIAVNARRLQTIGWALMFLQLLDIPGTLIARSFPNLAPGLPGIPFSPGGWLAVLMVFVLSSVFAAGSAMREELEGTV